MRFGKMSGPRHPSGCSESGCIRGGCRCEKSPPCWSYSVLIDRTGRCGTRRTVSLNRRLTRRLRGRHGSPSMRNKSKSMAKRSGCTQRSTQSRSSCLKSMYTAAAGTDPAAAFLHRLTEKHDVSDTKFLVDGGGYLTALFRHGLSGQLNYEERNHIEKWFQTVSMRIDRFHSFWRGSQSSARRWLRRFHHHYNHDRPN